MILPLYITSFFVASSILRANFKGKGMNKLNQLETPSPTYAEVIEPGLIIIRNYFSESEQKRMAEGTLRWDPNDLKDFHADDLLPSHEGVHKTKKSFSKWAIRQACAACTIARKIDASIPKMRTENMLVNFLTSAEGYVCHRNVCQVNDEANYSVANVCIGASCRFRVETLSKESPHKNIGREITLRSGDIIISNGNKKYSLLEVLSEECPQWLGMSNRLAFTSKKANEDLEGLMKEYLLMKLRKELSAKKKSIIKKSSTKRKHKRKIAYL